MNVPSALPTAQGSAQAASEGRLRGWGLGLARLVWLALAALLLANFVASIPIFYDISHVVCAAANAADCQFYQPTPATLAALHRLGLSLDAYVLAFAVVNVAVSLVFWVVGLLIFWRKSNEWMGLFASFVLVIFGSYGISDSLQTLFWTAALGNPFFNALDILSGLIQWVSLGLFLVTFPTGRFAPRWTWLVSLLWVAQFFAFLLGGALPLDSDGQGALLLLMVSLTYGSTAVTLLYRYLRVFTLVQRQQTKWVVFGVGAGVLINVVGNALPILLPDLGASDAPYQLLSNFFTALLFLPIPLSIGVAILRYRLWDIDAIINKALVYGVLTALLAAIYAGLILGLVSLAGAVTGTSEEEPVALVVATLAIAALFQPLRRRVQAVIDRRFYRRKYDAEKTLAAFSAALRDEVDLQQLRERLLAVVQETMQPAHVSLWLRQPEPQAGAQARYPDGPAPASGGR